MLSAGLENCLVNLTIAIHRCVVVGVEGRAVLLASLGKAAIASPEVFAREDRARPGGLYDYLASLAENGRLPAPRILAVLLEHLGSIWPSRLTLDGVPLGDTWRH